MVVLDIRALGRHIIAEFIGCSSMFLDDSSFLEKTFVDAARYGSATVLSSHFHEFVPHGVSGVVVLAESHLTVHTWPEFNYAAIDVFTCGTTADPWKILEYLQWHLKPAQVSVSEHVRGLYDEIGVPDFVIEGAHNE